jgi:hypothetical protein
LPEFHGNKGESWELYEMNIQLAYDGAGGEPSEPNVKRAHLLGGLRGEAAIFLELNPHLRRLSYEEALKALRKRFDQPSWKQIGELRYIRQEAGESARSYADRLRKAVRILDPGMEYAVATKKEVKQEESSGENIEAISEEELGRRKQFYAEPINKLIFMYFMTGLREGLQQAVRAALPRTLEDAIRVAEQHESYMELYHELGRLNLTMRNANPESPEDKKSEHSQHNYGRSRTIQQAGEQLRALNTNLPTDRATGNTYREDRQKPYLKVDFRPNIRCYNCQKEGHFARECRSPRRENNYPRKVYQRMEQNEPSLRRTMSIMPRSAPEEQRSNDHPAGKPNKWPRAKSSDRHNPERDRRRVRWDDDSPPSHKRASSENRQQGVFSQQKNGGRPPQRGGLRPLPRPLKKY